MGNSFLYRMPSGIPGDVSRRAQSVIEQSILNASLPFTSYGQPGKLVSGAFVPLVANDPASVIEGWLVRPYPTQTINADGSGVSTNKLGDRLRRGFMTVKNNAGTPALGGQVYVRTANPSGGKPIGGVEAVAETTVTPVAGANTGNGTVGTASATAAATAGAYLLTMLTATTFSVAKPDGAALKNGVTGAAYTAGGLTFTNTVGGTPYVAGDTFTITIAQNNVLVPNCMFEDAGDAAGNVEIRFNV